MQILTTKPSLICNILFTILGFFLFITFSREGEGRGHKTLSRKKPDFNILFKFVQGNLAHIYLLAANNEIFCLGSYIYLLTNEIKIKINILFFDRISGPEKGLLAQLRFLVVLSVDGLV